MTLTEINCKELFKKAYEKRYTWSTEFNGYQGKCIFSVNNDSYKGDFVLGNDFKPEIQNICLLYTSPSPRDLSTSRMPSSA